MKTTIALPAVATALLLLLPSGAYASPAAEPREQLRITFIGESSSTDPIWSFAVQDMRAEAESLGVDFVDRFAEGDFTRQAEMLQEEIARGVDGIIAPFFDPQTTNRAVQDALETGVKIYGLLGLPTLDEAAMNRIGGVAASWDTYGRILAEVTLPQVSDGAKILWPAEDPAGTYITEAVQGFEAYAAEQGIEVAVVVLDVTSDSSAASARQLAYLSANPDTDAIVTTGSIAIGAAVTAMRQGDLEPGNPPLAGFVTNAPAFRSVKDGYITQGIWPALDTAAGQAVRDVVAMIRDAGDPPKRVQSWEIVNQDNVDRVVPESLHR